MEHAGEVWLVDMRQAWPMLLARAVFAVAFGLAALISPTITLLILAWAFGSFAIIDGAIPIVDGIRRRDRPAGGSACCSACSSSPLVSWH